MQWDKVEPVTRPQEVTLDPDPPYEARASLLTYRYYVDIDTNPLASREHQEELQKIQSIQDREKESSFQKRNTKKRRTFKKTFRVTKEEIVALRLLYS